MKLRFAVIGTAHGHIYEFVEDMLDLSAEFVGVFDDKSSMAHDIARKYDVQLVSDKKALFDRGLDIVGTSAVNCMKLDIVEECERHGIHVIADKPLVVNEKQYRQLEQIISRGRIQVGLMLTARFIDPIYTAQKLIAEGQIGKVVTCEIFSPHRLRASKRPDWHFSKEQNGGIVIDLMVHSIDLFRWLTTEEISRFSGVVHKTLLAEKQDFFDGSQFMVTGDRGASGFLRVDWRMPDTHWSWGDLRVFVSATKGCLEIRALGDPLTREPIVILYKDGQETAPIPIQKCPSSSTRDFVARLSGKKALITHTDILEVTRLTIEFDKNAQQWVFV